LKKLAGRKDIEDALLKLEKVTVEEARMAAAEGLKAIHGVGDKVENEAHGIHNAVKAIGNRIEGMIQRVDDRVKGIGDMFVTGAQLLINLSTLLLMFTEMRFEQIGRQMANNLDAMAAEGPEVSNEVDIESEVVDNQTRRIEVSGVDGTQVIPDN
jgi:hypothetical protein